jgi:glycosyltransferase involved in cell wall biosynthesis
MRLLMLSTDRKLLDSESAVALRTLQYASFCESLTVVLAGVGERKELMLGGKVHVVYPGGSSKAANFFTYRRAAIQEALKMKATIVTVQDPFFVGLAGIAASRAVQAPLQVQIHTDYVNPAFIFESPRHVFEFCLSFITLQFATCVRTVSKKVASEVRKYTSAPISVLPIRVSIDYTKEMPRPVEFGDHKNIITVSRLSPEKRIDLVIKAVAGIDDAHLYIIGDGPLKESLSALAKNLKISDRVHFVGWVNDLRPYYQHADCFAQASKYEGYGVALVEALMAGCPAVATDQGIAAELPAGAVTITAGTEYDLRSAISTTLHSEKARTDTESAREAFLRSVPTEAEYLKQYEHLLITCGIHI